ncbi:DUF6056 family protein [Castellaniella hirudinis]|uniref:DUF6056 family protein n=1 Tax=Castellaniella hirudinis TaxID=1144617 RepID=UPI0039C26117
MYRIKTAVRFQRGGNRWLLPACIFVFCAGLVVNWLAPMSSDDYSYFLKGVSWDAVWAHYNGWSGRLVADTLSSLVLGLGSHSADVFNALALTALVWVLSVLGLRLLGGVSWAPDARVFLLVFALYWVNNPQLGHTTFWIVGAANYLWTNVLNFGFALVFLAALQRQAAGRRLTWAWALGGCVFAVIAGCTNENTALTTWLLLVFLAWRAWRGGQRGAWPWVWLACMAAGVAVLVLAPGNGVRALVADNQEWYAEPLWWRVAYHLARRLPDSMMKYWEVYLLLLLGMACVRRPRDVGRWVAGLIGLAVLANLILVQAPAFPKRALQGGFMYALVAASLLGHYAVRAGTARWRVALGAGLGACALQWVVSYALVVRAYHGAAQQDAVRVALVRDAIESGQARVEIPQYYFSGMLNRRDGFDVFFNGAAMARYYGSEIQITEYPVQGPYRLGHPPRRMP